MVYGRISFAIVSDRMFKSGPRGTVCDWTGRPDHVADKLYDTRNLDKPGLVFLGDRQIDFLNHWVEDWSGADMKVFLSQTLFANAATHHGQSDYYLKADLDSGGWPQSGRNRAIEVIRKAFPLHVCGDQHLTTMVQYGVTAQRDSCWSFCTPAISVCYQRWWKPDECQMPFENRPSHGLPNTGEYEDGLGNLVYMYAVGNPKGSQDKNRYQQEQLRASGFGIIRIDRMERTYTCESYQFLTDVTDKNPANRFEGFPCVVRQMENYGRKPYGYLNEYTFEKIKNPVIKVYRKENSELVYALRLTDHSFRPWVFEDGLYTIQIGDPDTNTWITHKDQAVIDRTAEK